MEFNRTNLILIGILVLCAIGYGLTANYEAELSADALITGMVPLDFSIDPSCSADKTIATISGNTNAHIAADLSYEPNRICATIAGSKTCTADNIIGYVYPVPEEGHFSVTPNTGWVPLCYGNMEYVYGNYALDCLDVPVSLGTGYKCVLSYTNAAPTDAHVGDCSSANENYGRVCGKVACANEAEECSVSDECCGLADGYGFDQYCSDGHCCEFGWMWSDGECMEAIECYPLQCPYDSQTQLNQLMKDYRCLMRDDFQPGFWDPPYNQVCCHKDDCYGEEGYCWCDIEIFSG